MAIEPIRWGLLGTGGINAKLLAGAHDSAEVDVVAVGSRTAERAAAFAAANGIPRAHGSYEALLADPDVQAVYIMLPNSLHHPWTMRALAAGKHVLCEKPYTRHFDQVNQAWDAAEAAGLVLQEAFMWRHTPQAARIQELLPRLGPRKTVRATFSFRIDSETNIRLSQPLEGGSLMDVGWYCVSAARYVAGAEPVRVHAEQVVGPSGVDRQFSGLMRFPDGMTATFTSGFESHSESLEVIGQDATLRLPDPWHSRAGLLYLDDEEIRVDAPIPYQLELEDMNAAIRGERAPRLGRADALGQARTIEALYRAAESGTGVDLGG
jgi:predicted dehydrogenase